MFGRDDPDEGRVGDKLPRIPLRAVRLLPERLPEEGCVGHELSRLLLRQHLWLLP